MYYINVLFLLLHTYVKIHIKQNVNSKIFAKDLHAWENFYITKRSGNKFTA
jgi:hypothetical protein